MLPALRIFALALASATTACVPAEYRADFDRQASDSASSPDIRPLGNILPDRDDILTAPPQEQDALVARNAALSARQSQPPASDSRYDRALQARADILRQRAEDLRTAQ